MENRDQTNQSVEITYTIDGEQATTTNPDGAQVVAIGENTDTTLDNLAKACTEPKLGE